MNPLDANPATLGARLQVAAGKWAIVAVLLVACVGGGYVWGSRAAATKCAARNGSAAAKIETREDKRDANIEAIGQQTRDRVAAAGAETKGAGDASAERIRTVYVDADCRTVPADIVREHDDAVERINAKVRSGMRPGTAAATGARPED
jgi:hypothetical protein